MEQMYHPNIYKTSLCTNFAANGGNQCQWGYFCTHAHGQKDIRNLNKKDLLKRQTINNKQKQQKSRNDMAQMMNSRPLETFKQVVSVIPKLFQKISLVDSPHHNNDTLNYHDQQTSVSQHSLDNASPSRSYHTPSYQSGVASLNMINTPSTKHSSSTPSASLIAQSTKVSSVIVPTSGSYCQSHMITHAMTPNTMTYEPTYYNAFYTFPDHLGNDKQREYSWDGSSNDNSNLQPSYSAYTPITNVGRSSPPISVTSFDMCNVNDTDINNENSNLINNENNYLINLSPNHGAQQYISSMSTTNLLPRSMQLSRSRSLTIPLTNSKLYPNIPSNATIFNQSTRHVPRHSVLSYQKHSPQLQPVGMQTTVTPCNVGDSNANIWSTVQKNELNNIIKLKSVTPTQEIVFPVLQSSSQQVSEIVEDNLINTKNQHVSNDSFTKETRNNLSYYFLGDDSLLSPHSNRPDRSTKASLMQPIDTVDKRNEGHIVTQLNAELSEIKIELKSEIEKNKAPQNENEKDSDNDHCKFERIQD